MYSCEGGKKKTTKWRNFTFSRKLNLKFQGGAHTYTLHIIDTPGGGYPHIYYPHPGVSGNLWENFWEFYENLPEISGNFLEFWMRPSLIGICKDGETFVRCVVIQKINFKTIISHRYRIMMCRGVPVWYTPAPNQRRQRQDDDNNNDDDDDD